MSYTYTRQAAQNTMSYTYIRQSAQNELAIDPADVMLLAGDLSRDAIARLIRMQTREVESQHQYAILPCTIQTTGHTEVFLPINPCVKVQSVEKRYLKSGMSMALDRSQYEVTRSAYGVQSVCVSHDAFDSQEQISLGLMYAPVGSPKKYYKEGNIAVVVTYEAGPENPLWEMREGYSILKNVSPVYSNLILKKVVSVLTDAKPQKNEAMLSENQLLAACVSRSQSVKLR